MANPIRRGRLEFCLKKPISITVKTTTTTPPQSLAMSVVIMGGEHCPSLCNVFACLKKI